MASVAKYNTRVVQKHDTKANWDKATNFIPLAGEIIIYDDLGRFKIGDGVTKVGSLPFANSKKSDVGLGNVDNTSDDAKPVSSAQQEAIDVASTKVRHSRTTTSSFRPVILHSVYTADGTDPGAATDQLYYNEVFTAQPSTGTLRATKFQGALKGNADSATKLKTARTIALGTGATGTATSFDGSGNITIPVTEVKEAYLSWGGRNIAGSFSALDAALIEDLSANRLAGIASSKVVCERSSNAGSTWTTYTPSGGTSAICTTSGNACNSNTTSSQSVNNWHRITIDVNGSIYCELKKIAIYLSTEGAGGTKCKVEWGDYSSTTVWTTATETAVSGWSGWNIINVSQTIGSSQYGKVRYVRLTFSQTSLTSAHANKVQVSKVRFYSNNCWNNPSTLASTGHLYSYDSSLNATFPAGVTATTFTGALSGNASTATKLATARTISLTGDVTGSTSFDGSGNVSITATVKDDSHNHVISNVDGLQAALNNKASIYIGSGDMPSGYNMQIDPNGDAFFVPTKTSDLENDSGFTTAATYTAVVPLSWIEDAVNGGHKQTIAVAGILSTDNPVADIVLGADVDANVLYLKAWGCITRITTADGSITLYANESAPTTAFTIQMKVVR